MTQVVTQKISLPMADGSSMNPLSRRQEGQRVRLARFKSVRSDAHMRERDRAVRARRRRRHRSGIFHRTASAFNAVQQLPLHVPRMRAEMTVEGTMHDIRATSIGS